MVWQIFSLLASLTFISFSTRAMVASRSTLDSPGSGDMMEADGDSQKLNHDLTDWSPQGEKPGGRSAAGFLSAPGHLTTC